MNAALGAVALLLAACAASVPPGVESRGVSTQAGNRDPRDWSNISVNTMIEKYGPPDRVETRRIVWDRRGPWKHLAVWDELGFLDNGRSSSNVESTISYAVPEEKREALAQFSPGMMVSPRGEELTVRSGSEERNFLMLNLADAVVKGSLTPEGARMEYLRTLRLSESGKTSPMMERLLFR